VSYFLLKGGAKYLSKEGLLSVYSATKPSESLEEKL
jgi:hypothetical protein